LFTLPFVLYYFGQFPNYFLLANLFIALPSTGIMYVGVLLALSPFGWVNIWLGKILDVLLVFSLDGLAWMEHLPFSVIRGIDWPFLLLVVGLVFVAAVVVSFNNRQKFAVFLCALMLIGIVAVLGYQSIGKSRYSGLKLYNVRSAFALSYIDNGKVLLYSSCDSLRHPTLMFSVLPDLTRYVDMEDIEFVQMNTHERRQNGMIQLAGLNIALIEDKWLSPSADLVDIVIWRKNNRASPDSLQKNLKKNAVSILDGSNSDRYVSDFEQKANSKAFRVYCLKNNFAYVWERD